MEETELVRRRSITILPEQVLTEQEAELMQKIDRGEVFCPRCEHPLIGDKFVCEDYTGVMVECLSCGFRELG